MRIAVFGSGGVGGYFGGRLAQAGEDVVFIARGKHLQAMREKGLEVESILGDFVVKDIDASDDPARIDPVDVVLVAVKSWQLPEAARTMRPLVGPATLVVPLQNGVEAHQQLAAELGSGVVVAGLCGLISIKAGPGRIRHTGTTPFIRFGELDNRPSERLERLERAFSRASGLTVEIPTDIYAALWRKFLLVTSWGSLGAVTRAPIGVVREQPGSRRLLEQAMREIYQLARARRVALSPEVATETMAFFDALPAGGTTSMQRDILAGRPSELEAQTGAVVRLGRQAGVDTPLFSFIYHALLPLELRSRGRLDFPR